MKRAIPQRLLLIAGIGMTTLALAQPAIPPASGIGHCDAPIVLAASDQAVRDDFNKAKGTVRLVFLVDPICSHCLRGMSDLSQNVLEPHANDSRLSTFTIHMSVLGAKQADVANSCQVMKSSRLKHYWDPTGEAGRMFGKGLGLTSESGKDVFAWDVWTIYGPDAQWTSALPPKPVFAMHQLSDLMSQTKYPFLDSKAFAKVVEQQLALLKRTSKSATHD